MIGLLSLFIIICVIAATGLYFFSSYFSIIPFFPSNSSDLDKILDALELKNDKKIIDLGAGSGTVIFAGADKAFRLGLNTRFVAIDINPVLTMYMSAKRYFHPNKKNIRIIRADLFRFHYQDLEEAGLEETFYLYVSPTLTDKIISRINTRNIRVICYFYPLKNHKAFNIVQGINNIFTYRLNQT